MRPATSTLLLLSLALAASAAACGKEAPQASGPSRGAPARPSGNAGRTSRVPCRRQEHLDGARLSLRVPERRAFLGPESARRTTPTTRFFAVGRRPSPGLERLSEEREAQSAERRIRAAIDAGNALEMFETGGLKNFKDSLVTTVHVDAAHPMVSVVNMIRPAPTGLRVRPSVKPGENGAWVTSRTLILPAYDSGGDDGTTYKGRRSQHHPRSPRSRLRQPALRGEGQGQTRGDDHIHEAVICARSECRE